jgi:hypothetical protein
MATRARRNLFMSTSLMCFLLAAAFGFDLLGTHWFWSGRPQVAVFLVALGVVLGFFWLRTQRGLDNS